MKYLRYSGSFLSIADHAYRAEIWQEAEEPFAHVGELTFDAETPVQIEWEDKAKEDVICGSTATINIISPSDRTYADLYSIKAGSVRLDVYRDDSLYWSGCMDTEFYEEPYQEAADYTVSLTFSDFGILDRLEFNKAGMPTIKEVMRDCIDRADIKHIFLDESMISSAIGSKTLRLDDLKVRADNFYDEDGEAMTLQEVIEGILQPLGLKVIQKNGSIYVFDLNGLHAAKGTEIYWNGDAQTMGTDVVYNNANITWSTYVQDGNLLPDKCWGGIKTDAGHTSLNNLNGTMTADGKATYYSFSYSKDARLWSNHQLSGFTAWTSLEGKDAEAANGVKFAKIVPQNDGNETEGMLISMRTYEYIGETLRYEDKFVSKANLHRYTYPDKMLFKGGSTWVSPVRYNHDLMLRIKMSLLFDPRFNPYEDGISIGTLNQKAMCNYLDAYVNFLYVPVIIMFTPDDGSAPYVWDNRSYVKQDISNPLNVFYAAFGNWVRYTETNGKPDAWGYLAYYDAEDRAQKCGVKEWKYNRQAINPHTDKIDSMLMKADDGQYINYPPCTDCGGKITIAVYDGAWRMQDGNSNWTDEDYNPKSLWNNMSWVMCKLPEIEILNLKQFMTEIDSDDIEYNAVLNENAKESIDIDTICGTCDGGVPTARGAYFISSTGMQLERLTRAGRTENVEDLFCGTLYSQYAERHTTLKGEAELFDGGLCTFTEKNQQGKKFMCAGDVQDVRMETSDATFIELSADEYKNQEGK